MPRFADRMRLRLRRLLAPGTDPITGLQAHSAEPLIHLGTEYGGWWLPQSVLQPGAVCYCAGAGEDISFDVALAERFACEVVVIDPTPRAQAHFERLESNTKRGLRTEIGGGAGAYALTKEGLARITFVAEGLWDKTEKIKFYAPQDPAAVSHSAVNLQKTETFFEAYVERPKRLMERLGHPHLTLLKLDIEGSEYKVLRHLVDERIFPTVLCIEFDEFHSPQDAKWQARIRNACKRLVREGYTLVHEDGRANYTFLHQPPNQG